jgi:hypothetical protein
LVIVVEESIVCCKIVGGGGQHTLIALHERRAEDALEVVGAGGEEYFVRVHMTHPTCCSLFIGDGEYYIAPLLAIHHL